MAAELAHRFPHPCRYRSVLEGTQGSQAGTRLTASALATGACWPSAQSGARLGPGPLTSQQSNPASTLHHLVHSSSIHFPRYSGTSLNLFCLLFSLPSHLLFPSNILASSITRHSYIGPHTSPFPQRQIPTVSCVRVSHASVTGFCRLISTGFRRCPGYLGCLSKFGTARR